MSKPARLFTTSDDAEFKIRGRHGVAKKNDSFQIVPIDYSVWENF